MATNGEQFSTTEQPSSEITTSSWLDDDEHRVIVIDNGSALIKAGFAGDDAPNAIFPNIIARPRAPGSGEKDSYIGDRALSLQNSTLHYPVHCGIVRDWDDMEKLWHHTFYNELRTEPSERPVLMTEDLMNPRANREKMTQIMFEVFNAPAFYTAAPAVLSLFAAGRTTGLVLDIGHGVTSAVPVYEGMPICHAASRLDLGGGDLTAYLCTLLDAKGCGYSHQYELIRCVKERLCYTALDFERELQTAASTSDVEKGYDEGLFQGPIVLNEERFKCSEALFSPALLGMQVAGIHELACTAIAKCHDDFLRDLYGNFVLAGGSTLLPGIGDRIKQEVVARAPSNYQVRVIAPSDRKVSAWVGGSILGSLSNFQKMWISKQDYDECGPWIVSRLCFSSTPSSYIRGSSRNINAAPIPLNQQ